jgi:hypothetical protein
MTRDELIEKMAQALQVQFAPSEWDASPKATKAVYCRDATAALTALETAIPGLSGLLAGTYVVVPKDAKPDWYWRQLDPDDCGDSIHEAIHMMGEGVVCHLGSSYSGPEFFAAIVPVLDPNTDDTEEITAETEEECLRLVQERMAAHRAMLAAQEKAE